MPGLLFTNTAVPLVPNVMRADGDTTRSCWFTQMTPCLGHGDALGAGGGCLGQQALSNTIISSEQARLMIDLLSVWMFDLGTYAS